VNDASLQRARRERDLVELNAKIALLHELENALRHEDRRSLSTVLRIWMERKQEALEHSRKALLERMGK
jgi:hypothetical protein